jgi:pyridoxal phosphate enzyme (YggS family)
MPKRSSDSDDPVMNDSIRTNLAAVQERIAQAARRAGRNPQDITLVAVSKTVNPSKIETAITCGHMSFGENYLQEARQKIAILPATLVWHFIGHLQSNKAKAAAELFQTIQTIDNLKLATAVNRHLSVLEKIMPVLVQVNVSGEPQKSGVPPAEIEALLKSMNTLQNLRITGLMTMPPFAADPETTRPYFRRLRQLADLLVRQDLLGRDGRVELSMGMSGDFEVAIEEGATIVRIGSAIFGHR